MLDEMGLPYDEAPGEAAFYGPKVDFVVRDCIGREWQLGTVQLDYNLPERFDLEYIGADNQPHRPVMIHRAPFGSMERFMGILIEHFAGAFPLWLAPEQVRVLPISDKFADYAQSVQAELQEAGFRATGDYRPEKIGAKIRDAQLEKIPDMLVVGDKEAENQAVAYRDRVDGDLGAMPLAQAIARLKQRGRRPHRPPGGRIPGPGRRGRGRRAAHLLKTVRIVAVEVIESSHLADKDPGEPAEPPRAVRAGHISGPGSFLPFGTSNLSEDDARPRCRQASPQRRRR